MANATQQAVDTPTVGVRITPTVERDYMQRKVFPALRIEHADHTVNTATGVFHLSLQDAEEVLADASKQRFGSGRRGLTTAYTSLQKHLRQSIEREKRRDTVPDPGAHAAGKDLHDSPAQFAVGDTCMNRNGKLWEVVSGYDLYCVKNDEGPYLHGSGVRIYYAYGYRVRTPGRDVTFFHPHELWDADGEIKHLQLVRNAANGKR